ncbi:hypothetical protein [Archangium sp.]|uniref:hypothetical protein n=1 Tax=Archangium sp. TaxID=1872627 RepID=UPI002869ED07|nr:hypothetical protein [Archangium sp.]
MADAKHGKDGLLGPYQLGRRHESRNPELDDLGRFYEARNVNTGKSALVLLPGPSAEPEEDCVLRVTVRSKPPYVAVDMEQVPATSGPAELAGLFEVLTRMLERVEWSDEMRRHMTRQSESRLKGWTTGGVGVALLVLFLVAAHGWAHTESPRGGPHEVGGVAAQASGARTLVVTGEVDAAAIAYPLPAKPFSDQAKAPCHPRLDEVEINGGCWVTVERRPPCRDNQAEYQGKCYLPVAARLRTPQSLQP